MGVLVKVVDSILFVFFLEMAIAGVAIHAQSCASESLFPGALVELKKRYAREYGDYIIIEKPHFYVGLVWLELLFLWPLSLLNLYAILAAKPWFRTTCLIYGVSIFTTLVAIFSEMIGSGRAPDKLFHMRYLFLALTVLAMLRGLLPHSGGSALSNTGKEAAVSGKKQA